MEEEKGEELEAAQMAAIYGVFSCVFLMFNSRKIRT